MKTKKVREKKENSTLMVRLTEDQREMLKSIATDIDLDLSNTVRFLIKKEYKKLIDSKGDGKHGVGNVS
ncbi:MAG: hypothetical protein C0425_09015 [Chlorobiaceae bacterium]|nr:hypothetical protein [Chlorobiaceae bacterium]MBA4310463.1 hypothetical protein [Chlorobiaceae bacterium]